MHILQCFVWQCLPLMLLGTTSSGKKRDLTDTEKQLIHRSGFDPDEFKPQGEGMYFSNDTSSSSMQHANMGSPLMPERFRCDGCYAVAMKVKKKLKAFEKKYRKNNFNRNGILNEVDIIDAFDLVCKDKFTEYGVKHVGSGAEESLSFSGPGLATHGFPGTMEYHRMWAFRLQKICQDVAGLYDEETIYEWHVEGEEFDREHGAERREGETDGTIDFRQRLCAYYCKDSGAGVAPSLEEKKAMEGKKKRQKRRRRKEL